MYITINKRFNCMNRINVVLIEDVFDDRKLYRVKGENLENTVYLLQSG